jgi:hypothetical protein
MRKSSYRLDDRRESVARRIAHVAGAQKGVHQLWFYPHPYWHAGSDESARIIDDIIAQWIPLATQEEGRRQAVMIRGLQGVRVAA